MRSNRWWLTTSPALAGVAAGLVIILATDNAQGIGEALFAGGLAVIVLLVLKKWVTDTSFEKQRLRSITLNGEEATRQAQVGHALQLAERERDRRHLEEERQEFHRQILAANERADQAEINYGMRAAAAERAATEKIAAAGRRADKRIAAAKREFEAERGELMLSQYAAGVWAERNGEVAALLATMEDPKLIHLDDHRSKPPETGNAGAGHR
jgi:hypothetical protein